MSLLGKSSRAIFCFCEGKDVESKDYDEPSLDPILLRRLIPVSDTKVEIIPVGGKHGMKSFIQGWMKASKSNPNCIGFRDRDFDVEPPTMPTLIEDKAIKGTTKVWLSHRAAIENYLIDGELIHRYWSESQSAPAWRHGPSPGVAVIQEWIIKAAREIAHYQAVRWSLAKLKPNDRWPTVPDRLTEASGVLPEKLTRDDCRKQSIELIQQFETSTSAVTVAAFDQSLERFESQFNSPDFWKNNEFLIWFHGKDVFKSMQRLQPNDISTKSYRKWAVEHVDGSLFPDLSSLAGKFQ